MAEQLPLKQLVGGSSPPGRTGCVCLARLYTSKLFTSFEVYIDIVKAVVFKTCPRCQKRKDVSEFN